MKGVGLGHGVKRAIRAIRQPSGRCARCIRTPTARLHASLPIRQFSSSGIRRAEDDPPRKTTSEARFADAELIDDIMTGDFGDNAQAFTAAPEIELEHADDLGTFSPEIESSLTSGPPAPRVTEKLSSVRARQKPSYSILDSRPPTGVPTQHMRVVPASPSYFTTRPNFTDHYLAISTLYRRHQLLPTSTRSETKITWLTLREYKALIGDEPVAVGRYRELIRMCQKLSLINPHLMPDVVHTALQKFTKEEQPIVRHQRQSVVDEWGRAYGLGRRKAATARAWIVRGKGEVLINGKSLSQYFSRVHQRESALYALSVTERVGDYNVFGIVEGGGNTGQAEALTLAVAKALVVYEPMLKASLNSAGCLTRDRRRVERKKPGHLKARKKPAWVKR